MVKLVNRAKMTTATTGTGTITLGSAFDGYQSFAAAGVASGDTVRYVIEDGANWEIGTGTFNGTTLTRTVIESSNADAAISLSGQAVVFVSMGAADIGKREHSTFYIYGTGTTNGVWQGSHPDITEYYAGLVVKFHMNTAGASTTTLDINGLGPKTVYLYNTAKLTTHYPSGTVIDLTYTDANGGSFYATMYYDTTDDYRIRWQNNVTAGAYIHGYQLLLEGMDGKFYPVTEGGVNGTTNTVSTAAFKPQGTMLYYDTSTDIAANAQGGAYSLYESLYTSTMEYWSNRSTTAWATAGLPLYLVGTINSSGAFILDNSTTTSFLTQDLPTSADGKVYMQVGIMVNTSDLMRLPVNHPMFEYKDGAVRPYAYDGGNQTITLSGDLTGSGTTSINAQIAANVVGANELNVTGNGTTSQYLRSDGDGSFTWATPPDTNTTYSAGSGIGLSGTTFSVAAGGGLTQDASGLSHADTSAQASINNSNGVVIQDVTLDGYGHVTALGSIDLDSRYYTEAEADSRYLPRANSSAYQLQVWDNRSTNTSTDLGNPAAVFEFKDNTVDGLGDGGTYHGVMTFQPWGDASGGNTHQLGFTVNGNVYHRTATVGGTWGGWSKMWDEGNDGSGSGLDADTLDGQHASAFLTGNQTITLSGDLTGSGTTSINAQIAANVVGAAELNVTGNGTTSQYLRSDGDGTFTWATPPDTNTTYSAGSGIGLSGTTFSVAAGGGLTQEASGLAHADTSTQASINNSNGVVIQDVTLDGYGHVTGLASIDLDGRYYTETESNARYLRKDINDTSVGYIAAEGFVNTGTGSLSIFNPHNANYATTTSTVTGAIKITLPVSWTNTMMRMTIRIYEYATNEGFDVVCGGYNYAPSASWNQPFAYILGNPNVNRNFNVRFGHDGSKCCIYIGETTSTWSYPQVAVTQFVAGYSNYGAETWNDGWDIGFATTLGTITQTISNSEVGRYVDGGTVWHSGNDGANSGLDADTLDGQHASAFLTGNQTITLSGDLTGSGTTSINAQIAANVVGANELNVTGNGTTAQYLRSDGDGSFTWATPPDTNTTYSAGNGISLSGTTFSVAAGSGLTQEASGLAIASNGVTATHLNVTGNGTAGQVLSSDGDGSFTWIAAGGGAVTDYNVVGSWIIAYNNTTAQMYAGTAYSGSSIGYINASTAIPVSAQTDQVLAVLSGTWRCMMRVRGTTQSRSIITKYASLFVRVT